MIENSFKRENYKYGAESFLSMFLSQYQFVLGADLESYTKNDGLFNKENPCNIYFVLRRPKVTIDPKSFSTKDKFATFDFIIHDKENKAVVSIGVKLANSKSELRLITEYPYNYFAIVDDVQTLLVARPSSLIDSVQVENNISTEILDYEVLYIGQAYGKNGERTALNRLPAHETVQKIYAHTLTNYPESDIWIMLTNFSQVSMLSSVGVDETSYPTQNEKRDQKLIDNFLLNKGLKFTEKQKINFTEAALIKMFEPKYNKEFKNNFPKENHFSYSECYSLDVRAIKLN